MGRERRYATRMGGEATGGWTENRPTAGFRWPPVRELWAYRELTYFLALRDVKARYKQAAFGIAWAVVQPLAGVALFTLVFRRLAGVSSEGIPYPVFALCGYLAWTYFSSTLSTAALSLVANSELVRKVYFPRLAAPVSALLPGLINLAPGLVLLAVVMAIAGVAPSAALLALPLCLVALMTVALGVGLLLATVNVRYRDVASVIGTLIQLWLFASPVAYPSTLVSEGWRWVYALNPMVGVIDLFRWCLVGARWPGTELISSAAVGVALLVAGLLAFARAERRFADVI
jgi:ABC-type polysaccharide/polyol phosphate export permease